jgi:hypothetical protein
VESSKLKPCGKAFSMLAKAIFLEYQAEVITLQRDAAIQGKPFEKVVAAALQLLACSNVEINILWTRLYGQ